VNRNHDWSYSPLSEVVDILDSRRVPVKASDRAKLGGDVPYYGATGQAGVIDRAIFDEPLVLLGEDGAPFLDLLKAKAYLIEGPAWVNNHAHVLRPLPGLDRRFLRHYLDVFDYRRFANGTTRLKLTQSAMRRIPVPVPKLDDQRRIVEILEDHLSRLDAATASLETSVSRIEHLRVATLNTVVQAAESLPHTELCRIGEVASVGTGTTPKRTEKRYYEGGETPWVTSGDLRQGTIISPTQYVTSAALDETSLHEYPAGTLLIAMYGEGKTRGTVAELGLPATINQACAAVELWDPEQRPWIRLVLEQRYWTMRAMASGGVQPNLNLGLIRAMEIPIPSRGHAETLLGRIFGLQDAAQRLNGILAESSRRQNGLRRAVLHAAFEGKLTGRQTDQEVIEELDNV